MIKKCLIALFASTNIYGGQGSSGGSGAAANSISVDQYLHSLAPTIIGYEDTTLIVQGNLLLKTSKPFIEPGTTLTGNDALMALFEIKNDENVILTPEIE